MVFDIIIASILIAFGILIILFSIELGFDDQKSIAILILGIFSIFIGAYIFFLKVDLIFVLRKIGGTLTTLFGLFMIIGFPDALSHQKIGFSKLGVLIGLVSTIVGIWLIIS